MGSSLDLTPLAHGGDLDAARRLFPDAPRPFLDLSTGINPHPEPVAQLSSEVVVRMPQPEAAARLAAIAAETNGEPQAGSVAAAPGS
jgi:cobalamin biosynthetic protein CobC